jgi:hypothetical protein
MKVGFFDVKTGVLLAVEDWNDSRSVAQVTAVQMTALFKSGRHRMPSPIWCVWDEETTSIFPLDGNIPSENLLNRVEAATMLHS